MKNTKIANLISVLLFSINVLSIKAFAAVDGATRSTIKSTVSCHAETQAGVVTVPQASQDADHIYFSGHDSAANYDATYHIKENFVYLLITTGPSDSPTKVSGNFLLNGVGLSATLSFSQGAQLSQLICQEQ